MKVLWQSVTLFLQALILYNLLILNKYREKPRFASIHAQPACGLASHAFSNSNAHGYPQE